MRWPWRRRRETTYPLTTAGQLVDAIEQVLPGPVDLWREWRVIVTDDAVRALVYPRGQARGAKVYSVEWSRGQVATIPPEHLTAEVNCKITKLLIRAGLR